MVISSKTNQIAECKGGGGPPIISQKQEIFLQDSLKITAMSKGTASIPSAGILGGRTRNFVKGTVSPDKVCLKML